MPIPKNVRFITFDCYGTLIDWEEGIRKAFAEEAKEDDVELDKTKLIEDFHRVQEEVESGSYELYAEVLRRVAVRCAKEQKWNMDSSRSGFLPKSVPLWPVFKETNNALKRFGKKFECGLLSNVDDKLLGLTRRHIGGNFDLVITAQQVRSYKPEHAHFKECQRRIGGKRGWVHIASGYNTDVAPCLKLRIPVVWVNRKGEKLESNQRKPEAMVKNLTEAARLLGA